MNTTENNKLIAEFMGYKNNTPSKDFFQHPTDKNRFDRIEYLKYDTDWNWLMEVVEKIESLSYQGYNIYVDISEKTLIQSFESNIEISEVFGGSKIENTYKACVEFIKWYNKQ